ncbi:Methionyl-tRNA formyltransferase [Marasmius sp. AFHP31]|nr:Methionyl-tRNA formyltransferase [Marasmius sp. AFHP31]
MRDKLGVEGEKLLVKMLRNMRVREVGERVTIVAATNANGQATRAPRTHAAQPRPSSLMEFGDALVFFIMTAESIVRRNRGITHQVTPSPPSYQNIFTLSVLSPSQIPEFVPAESRMVCSSEPTSSLWIRCAGGTVLSVPSLKQEGKTLVDAKAWWNGAESSALVDGKKVDLSPRE